jgi:hypothetical protein
MGKGQQLRTLSSSGYPRSAKTAIGGAVAARARAAAEKATAAGARVTVAAARAVAVERAAETDEGARAEGAPEAGTVAEVTAAAARVAAATVEAKAAARARLRAEMAEVKAGAATVARAERAERAVYMAVAVKAEGAMVAVATGGVDRGAAAAVVAKEAPKAVVREEAREEARVADLASAEPEMARVALGGVWGQWQRGRYSHAQTRTCVSRTAAGECKRVAQCSARRLLSCTSIDMLPRPSTASRMVRSVGAPTAASRPIATSHVQHADFVPTRERQQRQRRGDRPRIAC